ncbi:glycoside hydrolase family 9 protein [Runella sp. MFBS21]|uniref:fibronectin type III domain-containing protein n=1 Tax=Runella sp. MFBS21 TaxID=3034018 RepID=UPI0023F7B45E|nr:glycoside hydrolase family 9 protein [Runella sp. MFBS21]MDF7819489.1 glycoside hydrolase family 9 protein [Runella sp. MFBS21]
MKTHFYLSFIFVFSMIWSLAWSAPSQTTPYIKIDQFGYLPTSKKVAVVVDPQVGYNAAEAFNPGTGTNQYQIRRWNDDAVVFSGTLQVWNGGTTHAQSGDRGWWFDFSSVTSPGSYYIFDVTNNVGSYRFDIGATVYDEAMKHAVRTFYYQRLNFAKQTPFTDSKWADGASYEGASQDRFATSRYNKGNAATAKDLHGGWMDAGDVNKYTTFAESAVIQLAEAYRINPAAFKDNYNIPESGNGTPDILDELKYELDFLKRMQDATGTNGFLLKVGVDNYNEVSPISTDTRPRYYLPECTSATLAGAAMFAVAGQTFKTHAPLLNYGNDLITRAEAAWNRAKITTNNFTTYETACDDGNIKSGDSDQTADGQLGSAFVAAVYLYEATGKAEYKTFVESRYTSVKPYSDNWWGPYWIPQQLAFLRYSTLSGASSSVANNIRNQKAGMNYLFSLNDYNNATDLYRAHMANDQHHWGSNQVRANCGLLSLDFVTFNVNTSNHAQYREVAEQYLHWMNGVNPMNLVMLSNMSVAGAENSVNEIYHTWFTNGTIWDNVQTSSAGPAPGYVTGGPNKNYTGSVANITNQPPQKAYKEWNNGSPENSWEITEPSIYNQAAYIMLLGRLMNVTSTADTQAPTAPTNLTTSNISQTSLTLNWTAATDNVGVTAYEVYQGTTLVNGNVVGTSFVVNGLTCNTSYNFTVKAKDAAGNSSEASNVASATTSACDVQAPSIPTNLTASNISTGSLTLNWTASTDNVGVTAYEVYRGNTLVNGNVSGTTLNITGLICNTPYSFTVKAKDAAGNISASSNPLDVSTSTCPTGAFIYDDALATGWEDWSWSSTRNFSNTNPTQAGPNSIRVDYTAWGGLSLRQANAISTNTNTVFKFWVYSTGVNSIRFSVQTEDNSPLTSEYTFSTDANQWKEITVTRAQVGNPALIKRINFMNNSANNATVYFDQIRIDTGSPSDTQAPTAPTNLTSSNISQTELTLSWTASTDNVAVTAYEVYRGTTLLNANVTTNSFNVTGLTCGTAYTFSVKAKDAAGNISTASNNANATTSNCPDTQAPTAPTNLTASNISQTGLTLSWTASTDNVGVTAYEVYRGTALLNANVTTNSFNVTGLTCGTAYTFSVKAKDAAGNISTASNNANATTSNCPDTQAPTRPAGLVATNKTQTGFTLSWTASTDNVAVVAYEVYQAGVLLNGNVTSTSLDVTGLSCNTNYSMTVKAKDAAGNISQASSGLTVRTEACLSPVIYDDAIGANWSDWSWGTTRNFSNTTPVRVGSNSLKADFTAWSGISLRHETGISTISTTVLRFWIRSTTASSYSVYIQADDNGAAVGNYTFTSANNTWQEIVLNLSQLGNPSIIKRVNIQNNSGNNVTAYLDNIRLTNVNNARIASEWEPATALLEKMLVYPNPSEGPISIKYQSSMAENINFSLVDLRGNIILNHKKFAEKGLNVFELDLSQEKAGLYLIQLKGSVETQVQKVMIQR